MRLQQLTNILTSVLSPFFTLIYFGWACIITTCLFKRDVSFALQELDASKNSLTHIPSSIGSCKHLGILDLHSNLLTKLPEEIGRLCNLARFDMSFNRLQELPSNLCECRNLQDLDASNNLIQVEKIPRDLPLKLSKLVNFKFR